MNASLPGVALGLLVTLLLASGVAHAQESGQKGGRRNLPTEIELRVDGSTKKTWSEVELREKRVPGENPKGKKVDVLPLSVLLSKEQTGIAVEEIAIVRIIQGEGTLRRQTVEAKADAVGAIMAAVLEYETDKGNTWRLIAAPEVARVISPNMKGWVRLERVSRIEIVTKAAADQEAKTSDKPRQ
jgi:hypothetical protein